MQFEIFPKDFEYAIKADLGVFGELVKTLWDRKQRARVVIPFRIADGHLRFTLPNFADISHTQ
jgi:hypothetical protein